MPCVKYEVIIIYIFEGIVTFIFWTPHPHTPGDNGLFLFKDILEIALWGITKYIAIIKEIARTTLFLSENETLLVTWAELPPQCNQRFQKNSEEWSIQRD